MKGKRDVIGWDVKCDGIGRDGKEIILTWNMFSWKVRVTFFHVISCMNGTEREVGYVQMENE